MTLSFRTLVVAFSALVLLAFGFAIKEHHDGYVAGQVTQKIATSKQSLQVAQKSEQEAQVKADYYKLPIAKQKASVANARSDVKIAEAGVSITGDSANVAGDTTAKVVIPALITIIDRYRVLDTANVTLDSLHDKHAAADSVARVAAGKTESASVDVINDQGSLSAPRCGGKCGAALTIAGIIAGGFVLHHLGVHF